MESFDVVVVGGGPAGEVAAGRLADAGLEVALVEDDVVGGECSFYACMPSKALLRPQEVLREIRRIPGAAEAVTGELDVEAVLERRDEVIHDLDDSSMLPWLEDRGIKLYRGFGVLAGEKRVDVGEHELEARRAVILAGGTRAALPPIEGLGEAEPWTNREATTAKEIPGTVVILGGGVVRHGARAGLPLARRRGDADRGRARACCPPRRSSPASRSPTRSWSMGVDVRTGRKATKVERVGEQVRVTMDDGSTADGDVLVAALGRKPRTEELGLETVGLEGGGYVEVDENMQVPGHDWLYAIGDVNGRILLTHMGKYQARLAVRAHPRQPVRGRARRRRQAVPAGRLHRPAGRLRRPHREDRARGRASTSTSSRSAPRPTPAAPSTAATRPAPRGCSSTRTSDLIVGATITGAEVADFVHAATIAIVGEVPMGRLWHATPSFPTRSEIWLNLMAEWESAKAEG